VSKCKILVIVLAVIFYMPYAIFVTQLNASGYYQGMLLSLWITLPVIGNQAAAINN